MSAWERPWAAGSGPSHRLERRWLPVPCRAVGGALPCGHPAPPPGHVRTGGPVGCLRRGGLGGEDGRARPLGLHAASQACWPPLGTGIATARAACACRPPAADTRTPQPRSQPTVQSHGEARQGVRQTQVLGSDTGRGAEAAGDLGTALLETRQPSRAVRVLFCVRFTSMTRLLTAESRSGSRTTPRVALPSAGPSARPPSLSRWPRRPSGSPGHTCAPCGVLRGQAGLGSAQWQLALVLVTDRCDGCAWVPRPPALRDLLWPSSLERRGSRARSRWCPPSGGAGSGRRARAARAVARHPRRLSPPSLPSCHRDPPHRGPALMTASPPPPTPWLKAARQPWVLPQARTKGPCVCVSVCGVCDLGTLTLTPFQPSHPSGLSETPPAGRGPGCGCSAPPPRLPPPPLADQPCAWEAGPQRRGPASLASSGAFACACSRRGGACVRACVCSAVCVRVCVGAEDPASLSPVPTSGLSSCGREF